MKKNDGFFQKVYEVVVLIPPGRVASYGAIAAFLGSPGAARMVGWAMNHSHTMEGFIPAHRVVNRTGLLTGKNHFDSPTMMAELLRNEGIEVAGDQIVNVEKYFWDPIKELSL